MQPSAKDKNIKQKCVGSLLGLAIGDALGFPVEYKKSGDFIPISDFRESNRAGLQKGDWSDDTAMSLCLANSLIDKNGFDPVDQIQKYQKWLSEGYCSSTGKAVGVGQTVLRTLLTYHPGNEYVTISPRHSEGNGSLMRLTPVPLFFRNNPEKVIEYAGLSSKVTHGSPICADACRYYAGLILSALNGVSKEELLSPMYCPINNHWKHNNLENEIKIIALGSFKKKQPPEIRGGGYVVECLEAALWAFYTTNSFEDGVLRAVNLGDDADTTAAVYGQLAGAFYGIENMSKHWIDGVSKSEMIQNVAEKLFLGKI